MKNEDQIERLNLKINALVDLMNFYVITAVAVLLLIDHIGGNGIPTVVIAFAGAAFLGWEYSKSIKKLKDSKCH